MKTRIVSALTVILVAFTFTSCNFTENVTIKADGSGSSSFEMDASQLMAMAGDEMGDKKMDTLMNFKDLFAAKKDSIAKLPKEQQDRIKKMENFSMRMVMDPEAQEFKMTLQTDFKKISELSDIMQAFNSAKDMQKQPGQPDMSWMDNEATTSYAYDGKKFKRSVAINGTKAEVKNDSIDMYKAMLESATYTINYTFPKKVKKVSSPNAVIGADKKTVSVTYPFSDYLDKPKSMELEVEFEGK
jgi:hypothetical protein